MKKEMMGVFLLVLMFMFTFSSPMILAEDNESEEDNKNKLDDGASKKDIKERKEAAKRKIDNKKNIVKEKKKIEERKDYNKKFETKRKEIQFQDKRIVKKIERKVETKNGREIIEIKKRIIDENGREIDIRTKIETEKRRGKIIKKLKQEYKGRDIEAETELELEDEIEGNESRIKAKLSNGRYSEIKVLPDRVHEIAKAKLRAKNFTIELKEVGEGENKKAVYVVQSNETGRIIGIFKAKPKLRTEIDSETGEVIRVKKPWWRFAVVGKRPDMTSDDLDEEMNETEDNSEEETNESDSENSTDTNTTQ